MRKRIVAHWPLPRPVLDGDPASDQRLPDGVAMESSLRRDVHDRQTLRIEGTELISIRDA
jgi:hypothetical protein